MGKCFFFSQDQRTWLAAEEECQRKSSHLASISGKENNDFIASKLESLLDMGEAIWIGARQTFDGPVNGSWEWSDCSQWGFTSWNENFNYNPDNVQWQECAFYDKPVSNIRTWRAGRCNSTEQQFRYVCSKTICSDMTMIVILVTAITSILLILLIAVAVIIFKRKRKQRDVKTNFVVDGNELYGLYYTADGDRIDQGIVEVQDRNYYYRS